MSEFSDDQVLDMLRRRQPQGLDEVCRRYASALSRAAYLYLGDRHTAEDAAQDALIAAWDTASRARPRTHLRPWLYGILMNYCRKYRRSAQRRRRREHEASTHRVDNPTTPDAPASLDHLRHALDQLDLDHRSVVILRYQEGFSVAQTASALRIPLGTVKSRTFFALRQLRDLMED